MCFAALREADHLIGPNIYASGRLTGGIGDPNELAAILTLALSLALFTS